MAEQRPLVLIGGQVQQLPTGDTVAGATGGGVNSAKYNVVGDLVINSGTMRWYPPGDITLSAVYFSVGTTSSSGDVTIDVNKNGTSVFSGSKPTLTAGNFKSSTESTAVSLTTTDYLTVDVDAAGTGAKDAVVCIVYG